MRLTTLCVCGILLAFSSLSWTSADQDEADLPGDRGFGPCTATLIPDGPCRLSQDGSSCPYLFTLPPLTVHLPMQLIELETIVKDLQKLKDNVDQLRMMCADCTVSQTERECGKQREREHEKLNEGTDRHKDERKWLNERNPERPKDFSQGCGTNRVKEEKTMGGNGDTVSEKITTLEQKEKNKLEAEREGNKEVIKENWREEDDEEKVAEKDGKSQSEGAKRKDKPGQTAGGNDRIVDLVPKKVVVKNNDSETSRNKETGMGNSNSDQQGKPENGKERKITINIKNRMKTEERDHHVWQDQKKETEKKTQTGEDRGSDGIKMYEDPGEHINKGQEQPGQKRKKEMEKGIKVERNNEKSEWTEEIGHAEKEKTIKEGEAEEDGERETEKEIKTGGEKTTQSVQRDSDRELASSEAIERPDFVSISVTPHSTISLGRDDFMDSNEAITITSSIPSHSIADGSQRRTITADGLLTQSTGLGAAGISEQPSPDEKEGFGTTSTTTATMSSLGGPGQQITSATTSFTSITGAARPDSGFQSRVSSTAFPRVANRNRWAAKRNISSNTKTGMKPPPGRGAKPGERHGTAIKPEAHQRLKNLTNDRKPEQAHLLDKKTKHDQNQKPPHQNPTNDQKAKPGKDPYQVQILKPDQISQPDNYPTDQDLKKIQTSEHEPTTDRDKLPIQKPKFQPKSTLPVQRPTLHQRPQTVNATGSDKDLLTEQDHDSVEIGIINENSKPGKKPGQTLQTDKPDQKNLHKQLKSEEKTKTDQRITLNRYLTPDREPKPEGIETTSLTPKPNQTPVTESLEIADEDPSIEPKSVQDPTPGQTPDQKLKPRQKIPKINQKPKPGEVPQPNQKHIELATGQKTKPNVKTKPDQTPKTNQGLKKPRPDQMPKLKPKPVLDEIPKEESNKTFKPRLDPRHRQPSRPTVKPGATPVQRPKPAVQLKPSPKTKTNLDPRQTSRTTSDGVQNSQIDMRPASGSVKLISEATHSPGETEFSSGEKKTNPLGPKTSSGLEPGPFPSLPTLSEGFTMSPNSRITSDLRPHISGQPPLIPVTTRPNNIMRGILPSTSPGSTKANQVFNTDSSFQAKTLTNVEKTVPRKIADTQKIMVSVLLPSAKTTSTTTPAPSGPEPLDTESSTPSARELRVKINQVAAFFENSPKGHPEDNQRGNRPDRTDSKLPTSSKVSMAKRDCSDHRLRGEAKSGVYLVTPDLRGKTFPVFCDMELGGGGWTVLQRRQDGSLSFNRTWADYRSGFGEVDATEFWLGNNMIHMLTRDRDMVLRVELVDHDGVRAYAEYAQFRVASERMRYSLTVDGYSGTAGDALRFSKSYDHNNRAFTTPDRDNDRYPSGNCGAYYSSGWWFDACLAANLNGRYYVGTYKGVRDGIFWGTWHNISTEYYPTNDRGSFKTVSMMIRPKGFAS